MHATISFETTARPPSVDNRFQLALDSVREDFPHKMASKAGLTLTIAVLGCITVAHGHLNLFLNKTETHRLLGRWRFRIFRGGVGGRVGGRSITLSRRRTRDRGRQGVGAGGGNALTSSFKHRHSRGLPHHLQHTTYHKCPHEHV